MQIRSPLYFTLIVSLGGFLFGFDMGIISGVMDYAAPQLGLDDVQTGWVVSCPTFAAMFAMLAAGAISNQCGRKPLLVVIAILYATSALWSAYAETYVMLYLARMLGGVAFGAALIIAPTYIAEISKASNRGKLVSIQQLNICDIPLLAGNIILHQKPYRKEFLLSNSHLLYIRNHLKKI